MKRVLKALGLFVLVSLVALAGAAFWMRDTLALAFDGTSLPAQTADDVLAYLVAHPESASLATWTVGDEAHGVFSNADREQPLASTVKAMLLTDVVTKVDPDESVKLADWEKYWVKGTDGNAHAAALEHLGKRETYAVRDVTHAMIHESDNAAFDWLLVRLGATGGSPHPLSGEFLTCTEGATRESADEDAWRVTLGLRDGAQQPKFDASLKLQLACASNRNNRGTARAFAKLMERVVSGEQPGAEWMREQLEWPMKNPAMKKEFVTYGSKGGSLAGVLTSASYAQAKGQPPRVVALFFRDLPTGFWLQLMRTFAQQDLERRLVSDPAYVEKVRGLLTK